MDEISETTALIAGPPAANPPLFLAAIIIGVSLLGPVLFTRAGPPSPILAVTALALAIAGIITLFAAVTAARRRRADAALRVRARISPGGVTFYRHPEPAAAEHFAPHHIKQVWLLPRSLIIDTTPDHPKPGRHRLGFRELGVPRETLATAIAALNQQLNPPAP